MERSQSFKAPNWRAENSERLQTRQPSKLPRIGAAEPVDKEHPESQSVKNRHSFWPPLNAAINQVRELMESNFVFAVCQDAQQSQIVQSVDWFDGFSRSADDAQCQQFRKVREKFQALASPSFAAIQFEFCDWLLEQTSLSLGVPL